MTTHTIRRLAAAIALSLAVAVLIAPSALAGGRCPCNSDLPISADTNQAASASPRVVHVVQSSGFDWGDFGIGVVAAVGGLLVLGGLCIGVRQARQAQRPLGSV
jgi:hypothetical protein